MGIILTSTGLPLIASTGLAAARAAPPGAGGGTVPVPVPKPITLQGPARSISHRGVTFEFSSDVRWYVSANDDPVLISHPDHLPSGTTITAITPASAVVDGYQAHGAMRNPHPSANTDGAQGFDGFMGVQINSTTFTPYDAALNVDPAVGGAIAVRPGDRFTILKSVRSSAVRSGSSVQMVERYVPLTVMDDLPPSPGTWFRPAVSLEDERKAWRHRVEDIDLSVFRNLGQPPGAWRASESLAQIRAAKMDIHLPVWCNTHNPGHRFLVTGEQATYPRDYGRIRGRWACAMHIDPGANQTEIEARAELARIFAQWGIDIDGAHREGITGAAGAGHWHGIIYFYYMAAFMLDDADMLARAQAHQSSTVHQHCWITEPYIGFPYAWYDSAGQGRRLVIETYQAAELGMPEWRIGSSINAGNANLHASYRDVQFTTLVYELLPIVLLRNGFGTGLTGDAAVRNGPNSTDNDRAAALAYLDRLITIDPWIKSNQGNSAASVAMYDAWRDAVAGQPRWRGQPSVPANPVDEPAGGSRQIGTAGAGAGQIDFRFDWMPRDYSTLPITDRQVQVSMDPYAPGTDTPTQFVDVARIDPANTVGTTPRGTLLGFRPGTVHQVRWRQRNTAGWSRWTAHWELSHPSGNDDAVYKAPRNRVTTPGTPSGTLRNVIPPAVLHKPCPAHAMPLYEPVTDASDVLTFHAGMGYWQGGTGTLGVSAYQWQRDTGGGFVNIPGATGRSYARTLADSGAALRCLITVGGVQAASDAVSVPAANPTPGALLDFDLSASSFFDWPAFKAALDAADAGSSAFDLVYYPYLRIEPELTTGALHIKKLAANPTLIVPVNPDAPPGVYNWQAEFGGAYFPVHSNDFNSSTASYSLQIQDAAGRMRGDASITLTRAPGTRVHKAAQGQFTVSPGDRAVRLCIKTDSSFGGQGGAAGGAVLSKLKIWTA